MSPSNTELKVIDDFYDFALWLHEHVAKFPRTHRYSLGMAIESRVQSILGYLIEAKYTRDKAAALHRANINLEVLRFQLRLAKDLRALPAKSHGFAAVSLQQIGSQVGGWLRSRRGSAVGGGMPE